MTSPSLILALDQGTSSSRTAIIDRHGRLASVSQKEFKQFFPKSGWVEHDALEIWKTQLETAQEALRLGGISANTIAGIGITNQRETIVVWDRKSGQPIHHALVWQDRRTAGDLERLREQGVESKVTQKTGLLLDPYFSASKLAWILNNVEGARARAERGELAAGTIDSWLIWNLTGGKLHVTDVSNASRTMLMDLQTLEWDEWLMKLFNIPRDIMPKIIDSSGVCGESDPAIFGRAIPIAGIGGDQQCALFGQSCTQAGMSKTTFGTGCFLLANTGTQLIRSRSRLLTTVAWRMKGAPVMYALEGSVFMGGASIQWLRDGLGIIHRFHYYVFEIARINDFSPSCFTFRPIHNYWYSIGHTCYVSLFNDLPRNLGVMDFGCFVAGNGNFVCTSCWRCRCSHRDQFVECIHWFVCSCKWLCIRQRFVIGCRNSGGSFWNLANSIDGKGNGSTSYFNFVWRIHRESFNSYSFCS